MEPFKMACPKCGKSSTYEIMTHRSYYFRKDDEWGPRVFSCMCGKQLFGLGIKQEYDKQYEAWEAKAQEPEPQPELQPEPEPELLVIPAPREEKDPSLCSWKDCELPSRQTSKYCSVSCKNKYARWAYRKRKKKERSGDSSETHP